jgi:predicted Zn-dependent peptidase
MTVEITRLANGLHVLTHNMPHLESVALGIWVKAGARDERPEENGIAHFLEHMAFKGTKRRTAQEIAEEIESAGGEINAATGMETTTYYARTLKSDWPLAMDILADIFTESTLDEAEMERERDVILQEIAASNDQPDDLVFDLAQSASYGDHPLGRSILGTAELVQTMTREQMLAWRTRNYWASRMVVCATGNVNHADFAKAAEKHFGHIPQGTSYYVFRHPITATRAFINCKCFQTFWVAACPRGCFRKCARSVAFVIAYLLLERPMKMPVSSASMPPLHPITPLN